MENTNERYRNGATEDAPKINQTASSASPSPTCSPSSLSSVDLNIPDEHGNLVGYIKFSDKGYYCEMGYVDERIVEFIESNISLKSWR